MKFLLPFLFLCVCPVHLLAQDKHNLSIELNTNWHSYANLDTLDHFLTDTFAFPTAFYPELSGYSKVGNSFKLTIGYQPLDFFEVGIFGNYQYLRIERPYEYVYEDPFDPNLNVNLSGIAHTNSSVIATGLSVNTYFNKLLNWDQVKSSFLGRLQLSLRLEGGVAFSKVMNGEGFYPQNDATFPYTSRNYSATNAIGSAELDLGYLVIDKTLFSTIGVKCGYQWLNTHTLQDQVDTPLRFGQNSTSTLKLNLSGFYYGIYLKIGK